MLTKDAVSHGKLRGGFYSPDVLVDLCLGRIQRLVGGSEQLSIFEPAAGDGAFIRGLARTRMKDRISNLVAVEIDDAEAAKAESALHEAGLDGQVHAESVLEWNEESTRKFDVAVGNPPYVRFQFVSAEDRRRAVGIGSRLGVAGPAVSNLWIPVFLLALERLRVGGAFAFILPMEFMTGVAAGRVREWLIRNTADLTVDLFKPGSFPAVLQEVVVLSGTRSERSARLSGYVEFHDHNGGTHQWGHDVSVADSTWTGYLLDRPQLAAYRHAVALAGVERLGSIARFSVSTVTGANGYFCMSSESVESNGLRPWARQLLPRTRYAPGLVFTQDEHDELAKSDAPAWLISFAADGPPPLEDERAARFIRSGEAREINKRFKCRVREPWYRVPVVPAGGLLMSKRSDSFPRVVVNGASVVTTDTIYRGQVNTGSGLVADDVAASFHNSLTLLSVEIGGRSFGGGVLELVPSEIAGLVVPASSAARAHLADLDLVARESQSGEDLISATDALLAEWVPGLSAEELQLLQSARTELSQRRLSRSHGSFYSEPSVHLDGALKVST
jgi:hypothetical protein